MALGSDGDGNSDGDFTDAGEVTTLNASSATGCDVAGAPGFDFAVAHDANGIRLLVDRDGNGDFLGGTENLQLDTGTSDHIEINYNSVGFPFVLTDGSIFVDPTAP